MNNFELKYTGLELDKKHEKRNDSEWVKSLLNKSETLILPLWKNQNLFCKAVSNSKSLHSKFCKLSKYQNIISESNEIVFLGNKDDSPIFAVDFSLLEKEKVDELFTDYSFLDLRKVGPLLSYQDAAILAYARGLIYWSINHKYCSKCGSENCSSLSGNMKICSNKNCKQETYPRTDPAVIMIVEYFPKDGSKPLCLLGRQKNWPSGVYSTLAGFVDIGESLEEAVAREVKEESGINVKNIKYITSQPWPFPASIMIGFTAEAIAKNIAIDKNEMDDVKWFTVEELKKSGNWDDKNSDLRLSRIDSISRFLVDNWIEKNSD